ncbi:MAG: 4-(cytidine 5'-diphospho)-2-C-methyl-D-erythritol kinase [Bacillota bacterium]|nr:4-(cytidine 5'-diphospho)-2-C-methyl-D-erythritol kinase [Bacillota bacterium]
MKRIELKSYAKINLTLDVGEKLENGFHNVEMILQQILLCDDVLVRWREDNKLPVTTVELSTNRHYLPTDERNLAYKAAMLMIDRYGKGHRGSIRIDIKKRIPVAAGLAGGSSNGAAVLHALNLLWELDLSLKELCDLGALLGSDVPFCIMGQAAANEQLTERFAGDPLVCHCALGTGTGTELTPLHGLKSHLVLSKPSISVSTAQVYQGIDDVDIPVRPNNEEMIRGLKENNWHLIEKNMVNVLENFTLKRYPIIVYTKNKIQNATNSGCVLMSGSGPTVFGLCRSREQAKAICAKMLADNKESFWTRTTW